MEFFVLQLTEKGHAMVMGCFDDARLRISRALTKPFARAGKTRGDFPRCALRHVVPTHTHYIMRPSTFETSRNVLTDRQFG